MMRLTTHIERLLLTNDCVIVPGFGGFVSRTIPEAREEEAHRFRPVRKEIVFNGTLRHLDAMSGDLADLLDTEKQNLASAVENLTAFSEMLGENAPRVDSMMGNLNRITTELADAGFARELSETVGEMNLLLERIQEGDGTVGRLLNDPSLYESLNEASDNLASLLANLEQYPGRYVHFSLFGRSPEKMQAKAERQAAKAAERARRDSLKALR